MKKIFKNSVTVLVLVSLILTCINFPIPASALTESEFIYSGSQYYIKNKLSGKYLTVYNNGTANGTRVVQQMFTGGNNQKWRVVRQNSYGVYKLYSVSSGKVLDVYQGNTGNGAKMNIWTDYTNSTSQKFSIQLNTDGYTHRILTLATKYEKCAVSQGATINEGANVVQYAYNGTQNDQWIFQPVGAVVAKNGANYAKINYDKAPITYPYLTSNFGGDCTNFVSQCLLASGKQFEDVWSIEKLNKDYHYIYNVNQLNSSWQLQSYQNSGSPWISAVRFNYFWSSRVGVFSRSGKYISEHPDEVIKWLIGMGDVVQFLDSSGDGEHTMYISGYNHYKGKMSYALTYHSNSTYQRNLLEIAETYPNTMFKFFAFV